MLQIVTLQLTLCENTYSKSLTIQNSLEVSYSEQLNIPDGLRLFNPISSSYLKCSRYSETDSTLVCLKTFRVQIILRDKSNLKSIFCKYAQPSKYLSTVL